MQQCNWLHCTKNEEILKGKHHFLCSVNYGLMGFFVVKNCLDTKKIKKTLIDSDIGKV